MHQTRPKKGAAAAMLCIALVVLMGAAPPLPAPSDPEAPSPSERAASAVDRFAAAVTGTSRPDALETALRAYYRFADARPGAIRKPYLYFVDYGLSNRAARGWVLDMERLEVVEGPFTVAHGNGSSRGRNGVPTRFSNRPGSNASSLGLYVAAETYTFRGKAGGRRYRSIGLRMDGMSGRFNQAARRRGVVAHGAPYVSARDAGRSQGCPAVSMERAGRLLPRLAEGGVVILYSPNDDDWLENGPWMSGG